MKHSIVTFFILLFSFSFPFSHATEKNNKEGEHVIITSFYPLFYLTKELVANLPQNQKIRVINLSGSIPIHDYRLTPKDRIKIQKANLFILFGKQLEPWGMSIAEQLPTDKVFVVYHPKDEPKDDKHKKEHDHDSHDDHDKHHAKKEHDHDSHDDHDKHHAKKEHDHDKHDDHDEHHKEHSEHDGEEGHHHGHAHASDPHLWLDPIHAQDMVDRIAEKLLSLAAYKPFHKQIKSNAQQLKAKFVKLDQDYKKVMHSCASKEVVVSHDALGYLAKRYDFKTHSILGFSTHDRPSAKTLSSLIDIIKKQKISYILVDSNHAQDYIDVLSGEKKLTVLPFNTLEQKPQVLSDNFLSLAYKNLINLSIVRQCQPSK